MIAEAQGQPVERTVYAHVGYVSAYMDQFAHREHPYAGLGQSLFAAAAVLVVATALAVPRLKRRLLAGLLGLSLAAGLAVSGGRLTRHETAWMDPSLREMAALLETMLARLHEAGRERKLSLQEGQRICEQALGDKSGRYAVRCSDYLWPELYDRQQGRTLTGAFIGPDGLVGTDDDLWHMTEAEREAIARMFGRSRHPGRHAYGH